MFSNYLPGKYGITIGYDLSKGYKSAKDKLNDINETQDLVNALIKRYNFKYIELGIIPGRYEGFTLHINNINSKAPITDIIGFNREREKFKQFLTFCVNELELAVIDMSTGITRYCYASESLDIIQKTIDNIFPIFF